jgi:hypothetical protein
VGSIGVKIARIEQIVTTRIAANTGMSGTGRIRNMRLPMAAGDSPDGPRNGEPPSSSQLASDVSWQAFRPSALAACRQSVKSAGLMKGAPAGSQSETRVPCG